MNFEVVLLPRARHEILEAWEWYEDRQTGLGDRFRNEVYKTIREIEKHPFGYQLRNRNYREGLVKVFPYLVIYRVLRKEKWIIVSSVFHTSRNPRKKYK